MRVLIVALSTARWRAAVSELDYLLDHGAEVTLLTTRLDGWHEHVALDPRAAVVTLAEFEERHPLRRFAAAVPLRVGNRLYGIIRPLVMWRVARKRVLGRLDVPTLDLVLVLDSQSIPIGWHLARRHPGLDVSFSLDREKWGGRLSGTMSG